MPIDLLPPFSNITRAQSVYFLATALCITVSPSSSTALGSAPANNGPKPSLNRDLTLAFLWIRLRTHSGDPAANAKTRGGSPSLSKTSTFASLYSKIASTSSALPRLQAK
ncbi:E3 ubiquitin-protein ligase KEG [Senna tora]|uniref:E3 ubiquitin-protein ligase KEG n=1 Tax=Senna tora TaxID=362788 RepID=A0A834X273_9FABA|nr:E3 ubiquitin-protein ligase KEG [Senna tora]